MKISVDTMIFVGITKNIYFDSPEHVTDQSSGVLLYIGNGNRKLLTFY